MRYRLTGNWKKGLAFDLHTLASTYLGPDEYGHNQFENQRSQMGELVYQLKYRNDRAAVPQIIALLREIRGIEKFDFLIPVPSTKARMAQPVDAIATALGAERGVPVLTGYLAKTPGATELKCIHDPEERVRHLKTTINIVGRPEISGKSVLLVDDLYRSGATLNACSAVLQEQSGVASVCVLTMTRTRSKR